MALVEIGGCDCPPEGIRGMGAATYTPGQLASDWEARVFTPMAAKFSRPQTNATLYKLLQPELDRALQFVQVTGDSEHLAPATLAVRVAALRRVRDAAKVAYASRPNERVAPDVQEEAKNAALGVLRWLAAVSGVVLAASNKRADTVRDIVQGLKDAPKAVIGWGLESLGLPKWALPVALVVAGLVVVGQTTGAIKALLPVRANGRRRRRNNPGVRRTKQRRRNPLYSVGGALDLEPIHVGRPRLVRVGDREHHIHARAGGRKGKKFDRAPWCPIPGGR